MYKLIKKGYLGEIYINKKDNLVLKKYFFRDLIQYPKHLTDIREIFRNELTIVKKLNNIKSNNVFTPRIISIDEKNLQWEQEYFKGVSFYTFLKKHISIFSKKSSLSILFEEFGIFLAKFHNNNLLDKKKVLLHGDLSSHNIMFVDSKIFIFDPGLKKDSIYVDISKFLLNLYKINPQHIILSSKKLSNLRESFIKGYFSESHFEFNKRELSKFILKEIQQKKITVSRNLIYLIKKYILNFFYAQLEKKIQKGQTI
jgi:tRNA A-37 threonylcarbamoyl transferase component Bud32